MITALYSNVTDAYVNIKQEKPTFHRQFLDSQSLFLCSNEPSLKLNELVPLKLMVIITAFSKYILIFKNLLAI